MGVLYWTFRLMIGAGMLMMLITLVGVFLARKGRLERTTWFNRVALLGLVLPILANWSGWIFPELGRQPWVVFGLLKTSQSNSPNVSTTDVIITLSGYIVIYSVLIAIGGWLMWREAEHGPDEHDSQPPGADSPNLALAY